jgi:two-component system cell cycle response regulator CtrA
MSEKLLDALTDQLDQVTERNRQLEELLALTTVWIDPAWRLSMTEARLFAHLVSRPVSSKKSVMMALYSGRAGAMPDEKIVDAFICKLRKRLKAFGIVITTVRGRGFTVEGRERMVSQTDRHPRG